MRDYFLRYTGPKIDELLDAVANATEYQLCVDNVGGNVVRVGTIEMEGDSFGIYEFYYKTSALPDTIPLPEMTCWVLHPRCSLAAPW